MDGLGRAGSLNPGSNGQGQGAFENFLASAIATIVTIIFSWRLLLETQDPSPNAIEASDEDKCQSGTQHTQGHASETEPNPMRQVDIDYKTVSKVTVKSVTASPADSRQSTSTRYDDNNETLTGFKTSKTNHVNKGRRGRFRMTEEMANNRDMRGGLPDRYVPAPAVAAADQSGAKLDLHRNSEGLLPRPSWALDDIETQESLAHIEIKPDIYDSSEDNTETEGDISSDSTLEYNECDDDADHSDSDGSLGTSNYSDNTREFYLVGDPLGDDSSESEYCVVFNSMLEAITEEDTDDMSEVEKENQKVSEKETDQVDSFVIPKGGYSSDSDSAGTNTQRFSDGELTSDTNSIDVNIDTDAYEIGSSPSPAYGPIINTRRPLVIGPYRDRHSRFSNEKYLLQQDLNANENDACNSAADQLSAESESFSKTVSSCTEDAANVNDDLNTISHFPKRLNHVRSEDPMVKIDTDTSSSLSGDTIRLSNGFLSNTRVPQMERNLIESSTNIEIDDFRSGSDQSQINRRNPIGEREDYSSESDTIKQDDQALMQSLNLGRDDRSTTTVDTCSDFDSLSECYDQFKKVALNYLEHTSPTQPNIDTNECLDNHDQDTNSSLYLLKGIEQDAYTSQASLSKSDFGDHKSLSDGKHSSEVVYDESLDTDHYRSDQLSKFEDAPLSGALVGETPVHGFSFVRNINTERNFVLRNIVKDKERSSNIEDDHVFEGNTTLESINMQETLTNTSRMSPYGSSSTSGLPSTDKKTYTSIWDDDSSQLNSPESGIQMDNGINKRPRGPISERTVGKFDVRPHPNFRERELDNNFMSKHTPDRESYVQDQPLSPGATYVKGSNKLDYSGNRDLSFNSVLSKDVHSKVHDYDHRPEAIRRDIPNTFDPNYFHSLQQHNKDQHSHKQLANPRLNNIDDLAERETYTLSGNIVAYQDMHENRGVPCHAIATSSAMAHKGDKDGDRAGLGPLPTASAVASTEATSENPYIAVARATARAATIASANATAGIPKGDLDRPESPHDISVVVSTSCTIKEGDKDLSRSILDSNVQSPNIQYKPTNKEPVTHEGDQKKKMMITIEESQDSNRREYRTLECEVPKNTDGDVTAMISEAVKRIIASQGSLAHQKGSKLNRAIDQITKQVVSAYSETDSDREDSARVPPVPPKRMTANRYTQSQTLPPGQIEYPEKGSSDLSPNPKKLQWDHTEHPSLQLDYPQKVTTYMHESPARLPLEHLKHHQKSPPERFDRLPHHQPEYSPKSPFDDARSPADLYDRPSAKSETIPEFRMQSASQPNILPRRIHNFSPKSQTRGQDIRPGAYLSRLINRPGDPDKSIIFNQQGEKAFYVTGKDPNAVDDIVLRVTTDEEMQPSVEHILLSESESDRETPLMERKQYSKLNEIKEEDKGPSTSSQGAQPTKKAKPARPRLTPPTGEPPIDEFQYVPPEAWSVCHGCTPVNSPTSPTPSDSAIKGILKSRPDSSVEEEQGAEPSGIGVTKSKSSDNLSHSNKDRPPVSKSSDSLTNQPPVPKPRPSTLFTKKVEDSPKKPYQSVLLTPISKDIPSVTSPREASPIEKRDSETKKFFFEPESKQTNVSDVPVAIPNTRPTRIDIEFEKRKREWGARTPSPRNSVVMVNIDIDGSKGNDQLKKPRSRSVEDLKKKLKKNQLKAPSANHFDKHWEGVSEKLSRSQERMLTDGYRSRGDSFSSGISQCQSGDSGMRRSKSMGTLAGQFFSDRRSYTSLIETDLDTGISTATPLIKETNVDEFLAKSKSMTNLNTAKSFKTYDIYSDDYRYRSSENMSNPSSGSSQRDTINQIPIENHMNERSLSAHELRISNSLNKLSLPTWYRAADIPPKPVQLINTRKPPRTPYDLPPLDDRTNTQSKQGSSPSKPIIISHRVSRSISKSPSSSTCSTPVGGQPNFELPSNKLRQGRETSLSPIPIKSPDEVPPLPPRDYLKKGSARDAYLKLKAQADPSAWGPLSVLQPRTDEVTEPYQVEPQLNTHSHYTTRPIPKSQENRDYTGHSYQPHNPSDNYVSQKYFTLSTPSDSLSSVSEPIAPKLPPRGYLGESSDSGMASLDHQNPRTTYAPGKTVSNLVTNLKIDTNQGSPIHNSGIDTGSPDGAYKKMLHTLDSERQEIENKANDIVAPERDRPRQQPVETRDGFPILSLTTSPSSKRRSFRSAESMNYVKDPEPTNVTMTFTKQDSFKRESKNEAVILDTRRKGSHTLDEVLGGLLAIPPPPGHPDDEMEDMDDSLDTPKSRNFKLLKRASTPRSSELSLKSKSSDGHGEDSTNEVDENTVIIQCRNSKCGKSTTLVEARNSYKTCHSCFTYYCSRDCRKEHWERHKRKCLYSRINSGCKHIMKKALNNDAIAEELSKIARTGYLTKGRGCVMLVFSEPSKADRFLMEGFKVLDNPPHFASIKEVQKAEALGEHEKELIQNCKSYNPELKYVLEVAIVTGSNVPVKPIPRKDIPVIKKCAKVRLHSTAASKQTKKDEPETLILTAVPGSEFTENMEEKQAREICLVNIQRKLRQRGVSLRHQYPDIYKRLCAYVSDNEHFSPISLYPMDVNTGKRFMCLIMPNSEPEVDWMYNRDLLDDLDLNAQV